MLYFITDMSLCLLSVIIAKKKLKFTKYINENILGDFTVYQRCSPIEGEIIILIGRNKHE